MKKILGSWNSSSPSVKLTLCGLVAVTAFFCTWYGLLQASSRHLSEQRNTQFALLETSERLQRLNIDQILTGSQEEIDLLALSSNLAEELNIEITRIIPDETSGALLIDILEVPHANLIALLNELDTFGATLSKVSIEGGIAPGYVTARLVLVPR